MNGQIFVKQFRGKIHLADTENMPVFLCGQVANEGSIIRQVIHEQDRICVRCQVIELWRERKGEFSK